jgi:LmbE family N-acetylglucosaminyl deacetylase
MNKPISFPFIRDIILFFTFLLFPFFSFSQDYQQNNSAQILQKLQKLGTCGSVLYIAAHPDDENTRLLSWLANEKMMRTAYLSITRGDGGQNLIGTEQGKLLGMIRTQELLQARKVDKAEQFFTRAVDFGYSKTPDETLMVWDKEEMLQDIVWIIRSFKPDVIITRFPSTGEGGHGHHTASAILAIEAFEAAADPNKFPEQLKYTEPWQAKRLFWNNFMPMRDPDYDKSSLIHINIGDYNPLFGASYGEIAAQSRSMHKSQGFGSANVIGPISEYFQLLKGEPAQIELFENIDVSWKRIKGSGKIPGNIQTAIKTFDPVHPQKNIPHLLKIKSELNKLEENHWVSQKKKEVDELLVLCAGLWAEAVSPEYYATPGDPISVKTNVVMRNSSNIKLEKISINGIKDTVVEQKLPLNTSLSLNLSFTIPEEAAYSNPYWLREGSGKGIFDVSNITMVGKPEDKPTIEIFFTFHFEGQKIIVKKPLEYKWVDPVDGERRREFLVLPEVLINTVQNILLFRENRPTDLNLNLKAGEAHVSGKIELNLPPRWVSTPSSIDFSIDKKNAGQNVKFTIAPPAEIFENTTYSITPEVKSGDKIFNQALTTIEYPHIPVQNLLSDATIKLVPLNFKIPHKKIGYIPGADNIPVYLKQLGYDLTLLSNEILEASDISQFDVIVVGIRAYNTNEKLRFYQPGLLEYVKNGGTLLVQYNTSNFLGTIDYSIGPYLFKISRDRITDENSIIKIIQPEHPLLNFPNKITPKDFDGWVQERGLYFAKDWDEKYTPLLSMSDPLEEPLNGALIFTKYGKGKFIYTGISFFRQLPAGVSGAWKLFVNLLE